MFNLEIGGWLGIWLASCPGENESMLIIKYFSWTILAFILCFLPFCIENASL